MIKGLKLHYFKYVLLFIFFICGSLQIAYAENWLQVDSNGKIIFLDRDSIKSDNGSVYYNVRYYDSKAKEDFIVTIQSAKDKAGVVSTCKFSDYREDKSLASTNTKRSANSMKSLDSNSFLYNADIVANVLDEINVENKEPDFGPYMEALQHKIKKYWTPPKENKTKKVVLLFKIDKNGKLLSNSVLVSSGKSNVDQAALKAVSLSAPFAPLPEEYKGNSVYIQFTFDYNVYKNIKGEWKLSL